MRERINGREIYFFNLLSIILINCFFYYNIVGGFWNGLLLVFTSSYIEYLLFVSLFDDGKGGINKGAGISFIVIFAIISIFKIITITYYKQFGDIYFYDRIGELGATLNTGGTKFIFDYFRKSLSPGQLLIFLLSLLFFIVNFRFIRSKEAGDRPVISLDRNKMFISMSILFFFVFINFRGNYFKHDIYLDNFKKIIVMMAGDFSGDAGSDSLFDNPDDFYRELMSKNKHTNEFTGLGNNKNLIVIQVESLQNVLLNRSYNGFEVTPYLNSLTNEDGAIYFTDYMQLNGLGNTSDAEFVSMYSLFANNVEGAFETYKDNYKYGLVDMANLRDYHTIVMHGYTGNFYNRNLVYPRLHFKETMLGENYVQDEIIGMGLSDASFFKQSLERIKELNDGDEKFFALMITLSHHTPFELDEKYREIEILDKDRNSIFANHLNTARYFDNCLRDFIEGLKDCGIYDDCVIAIYGDHFAIPVSDKKSVKCIEDWLGRDYDYDSMFNIPLLILTGEDSEALVNNNLGSHIDFLPTIVNIMGWNEETTPIFGKDLLEEGQNKNNIVFSQTYMIKGSYITDDYLFEMSRDGIFNNGRLVNRKSRELLDTELARETSDYGISLIDFSNNLVLNNRIKGLREEYAVRDENGRILNGELDPKYSIMHGGGALDDEILINSIDALNYNYSRGKRYFEVDLSSTSDGYLVANHGWDNYLTKIFDISREEVKIFSYEEYMGLKGLNGIKATDFNMIMDWLNDKRDVFIITDIKNDNLKHLEEIANLYPDKLDNIIPQIYCRDEYDKVKEMGFSKIIFTLYLTQDSGETILDFYNNHEIHSITISTSRFMEDGLGDFLIDNGVKVNVHTVNDYGKANYFIEKGVNAIYTDFL